MATLETMAHRFRLPTGDEDARVELASAMFREMKRAGMEVVSAGGIRLARYESTLLGGVMTLDTGFVHARYYAVTGECWQIEGELEPWGSALVGAPPGQQRERMWRYPADDAMRHLYFNTTRGAALLQAQWAKVRALLAHWADVLMPGSLPRPADRWRSPSEGYHREYTEKGTVLLLVPEGRVVLFGGTKVHLADKDIAHVGPTPDETGVEVMLGRPIVPCHEAPPAKGWTHYQSVSGVLS